MCMICIDLDKDIMTAGQAITNLHEMKEMVGPEHSIKVMVEIITRSLKKAKADEDLNLTERHFKMVEEIIGWLNKEVKGISTTTLFESDEAKICV